MTRANPAAPSEGDGCTETGIAGVPERRPEGRLQQLTIDISLKDASRRRNTGMGGHIRVLTSSPSASTSLKPLDIGFS